MKHYTAQDFQRYYGGAYVKLDDGTVGSLMHDRHENGTFIVVDDQGATLARVRHDQLDWSHVRCPPLGYVHLDDGYRFYHLHKGQHDGTPKGLNPSIVNVSMPAETRAALQRTKLKLPVLKPRLSLEIAKAVLANEFVSIRSAVDKLMNSSHAVGFALSRDAGLTLGLHKHEPIVGLFQGRKACTSRDGIRFTPVAEWAEGVVERHFRR